MKILVTGATGFIGNHVVNELLKDRNIKVICTSTNSKNAESFSWYSSVTFIEADLNDRKDNFFEFFHRPDIVIHLAWQGLPNYMESFHIERNLPVNEYFIENLLCNGLKKLVVSGTCFEYGLLEGELSEDMIVNPVTKYGIAKNELRMFIESLKDKYAFDYNWIRLFYMYGEGQNKKSLLELLLQSVKAGEKVFNMSGGEQIRDYLPVKDVALNIVRVSMQNKYNGIVNSCSGNPTTIKGFVEKYVKDNNINISLNYGYYPYVDYEPMSFWGSAKLLYKVIADISY